MQTVVETPTFSRQAEKLFREEEKPELIDYLAMKADLTPDERRTVAALASALKATAKEAR